MKKLNILAGGVLTIGVIAWGVAAASAGTATPDRPSWVTTEGRADLAKISDNEKFAYRCWSGKNTTLTGKDLKRKQNDNAAPGSEDYKRGMAKAEELSKVPGAVHTNSKGGETINIDDNNPEVQRIMIKYENKETPQCQ